MPAERRLLSVNTAAIQTVEIDGRRIATAIGKRSVSSLSAPTRIAVRALGLEGDEQADPTVHGGLSKAVYAYPHEHYAFWQTVRGQAGQQAWDEALPHGMLGENLTLSGLLEGEAFIGDVLRFPDCTLAISEPRQPCYKFAHVMGFPQAVKLMSQSGYCGYYLSVRTGGSIAAGEAFELIPGPREVGISELFKVKMKRG
ncbi:MOSC domain-containing protein [Aquabacterium sp.]|uniref:MOSC domain-containing protein n=1 Tax=Aquabacterium sp. TaxID=1872578 RepID=UPI0025BE6EE4|nr:MOSC domain-containing protein [Aquabacterium sp.]